MTWRELVFEICHKIPDEQFDDEVKIIVGATISVASKLTLNEQAKGYSYMHDAIVECRYANAEPMVKNGEWTLE